MSKKVENLLDINDLDVRFQTENGLVQALRDVSFEVRQGEVLALVGRLLKKSSGVLPIRSFRRENFSHIPFRKKHHRPEIIPRTH